MNLKNLIRKNTTTWIDGVGISIGADGIARGVPSHLAKKLLENAEVWQVAEGLADEPEVINVGLGMARAAAPLLRPNLVLVPESLAFLEGLKLEQVVELGRLFTDDASFDAAEIAPAAHAILAFADLQLVDQLRQALAQLEGQAPAAPVAEVAPEELAPEVEPEAAPDALEGVQDAPVVEEAPEPAPAMIDVGKRKPGPKPKAR